VKQKKIAIEILNLLRKGVCKNKTPYQAQWKTPAPQRAKKPGISKSKINTP
jgi:hypothetical protein